MNMNHSTSGRDRPITRMLHSTSGRQTLMLHSTSGQRSTPRFVPPALPTPNFQFPGQQQSVGLQLHDAFCDNCNLHIQGKRYKCSVCVNFDFCSRCMDEYENQLVDNMSQPQLSRYKHPLNNHIFQRICIPISNKSSSPFQNRESWIHSGVKCSSCVVQKDIVGYRYFCTNCAISLCEACEQAGVHRLDHNLLKMVPPHIANDPMWQQTSNNTVR